MNETGQVVAREPSARVAVDVAVFTVHQRRLHVLLAAVRHGPFQGRWALPGGRVSRTETLDEAATRELGEPTGLTHLHLEQLSTFGHPSRDPQDRIVSVTYVALIPHTDRFPRPTPGGKYTDLRWFPVVQLPELGYDHAAVIAAGVERLRTQMESARGLDTLMAGAFSLTDLQETMESILGRPLDRRNFRKRIMALDLLDQVGEVRRGPHRPAALYAFRPQPTDAQP